MDKTESVFSVNSILKSVYLLPRFNGWILFKPFH